ncbi:MAG: alpha/beta hydrolase [Verrucomicrobiota bacterium]
MNTFSAETIRLWEKDAPGAKGTSDKDIPTLSIYLPEEGSATGAAMVICPGGGYGGLAQHEGKDYGEWLAKHGVAGFVLKYRLGSAGYRHPVMLQDVSRAMRLVRSRASEWKVDPKRIGVMGSSAGGHLASTLLTHFDDGDASASDPIEKVSSRPDLGILCYPVITMGEKTHQGSKKNLLGDNPSDELVKLLSNELQVTAQTPPTFLFHTAEDQVVPVENSLMFATALAGHDVPFDLHVYEKGRHGIGLANGHPWTEECLKWLKLHDFVK